MFGTRVIRGSGESILVGRRGGWTQFRVGRGRQGDLDGEAKGEGGNVVARGVMVVGLGDGRQIWVVCGGRGGGGVTVVGRVVRTELVVGWGQGQGGVSALAVVVAGQEGGGGGGGSGGGGEGGVVRAVELGS